MRFEGRTSRALSVFESFQLQREFGRAFDVSGTGQYLVVHPAGQRDRWADRFEQLYRSMIHYLTARRFEFIPIWGYAVMMIYAMRRVQCPRCGVKVESVPEWDIHADRARLIAAGATPVGEVTTTPAGDQLAFLRDPWNLPFQFVQRKKPLI